MTHFWMSLRTSAGDEFAETASGPTDAPSPTTKAPELANRVAYLAWDENRPPKPADGSPSPTNWTRQILAETNATGDNASLRRDIVFLVHGYNTSAADAYQLHYQVERQLAANHLDVTVISFDWPSGTNPIAYLADRHTVILTALCLVNQGIRLFSKLSVPNCKISVHVVAHSMGTFVVQTAFQDALHSNIPDGSWSVGQVAFLAADLASDSLLPSDHSSDGLYKFSTRITNYFSGYDEVLMLSNAKRLGLAPRAGRVGVPLETPNTLIDVNCSDRYLAVQNTIDSGMPANSAVSHSWYFYDPDVMKDLSATLAGRLDRNVIPTRSVADGVNSFKLN